jgi:hypothetical protein
MSAVMLVIALLVFGFAYYAYRHEAINRLTQVGGGLRTSSRPSLKLLLLRAYV